MYKVNKSKCLGCGVCVSNCPEGMKMGPDNKAEVIDQKELEECGGDSVCPMGAIEKISGESDNSVEGNEEGAGEEPDSRNSRPNSVQGFGNRDGSGRGPGRGLGQGPRDGSGKGPGRGLGRGLRK